MKGMHGEDGISIVNNFCLQEGHISYFPFFRHILSMATMEKLLHCLTYCIILCSIIGSYNLSQKDPSMSQHSLSCKRQLALLGGTLSLFPSWLLCDSELHDCKERGIMSLDTSRTSWKELHTEKWHLKYKRLLSSWGHNVLFSLDDTIRAG